MVIDEVVCDVKSGLRKQGGKEKRTIVLAGAIVDSALT
jgi:hypothetical protein